MTRITRRTFLAQAAAGVPVVALLPRALGADGSADPEVPDSGSLVLWYEQPASKWTEALPIGNGRLGAMVFGGTSTERLQLNEDTLSAGGPYDPANPDALNALPEARRLIFEGHYREAHELIGKRMMARPLKQMPYEPVGDLVIDFPDHDPATNYRRQLDLDTAIASVTYTVRNVSYVRETISSPVDQVIAVHIEADRTGAVGFDLRFSTPQRASVSTEGSDTLVMRGVNGSSSGIHGALRFQARVRVIAGRGTIRAHGDSIVVRGAQNATLLIAAATSYVNSRDAGADPESRCRSCIDAAAAGSWETMRADHVREYQKLFRRVRLDLGRTDAASMPTDKRIREFFDGDDPQLAALYFQYGRYLLISSSQTGTQPANLQGLWNDSMSPPWGCKYTVNINTEMNYWPAETTNLAECHEPLLRMVSELVEPGSRTAQVQYGAGGWVCHHNTDLWRATAPIDGARWGFWPTGGAWLCTHLWMHYEFSGDKEFLARAYPVMKGAAQFFVDTLVEEPRHHWLVTAPSISPENAHHGNVAVCAGPTMDMQILRDLFSQVIRAAELLGRDEEFRAALAGMRQRLAPTQIGKAGQIQEWLEDWDMEAPDRHHRHVSHLYGLFPGSEITAQTPDLFAAARKTLELRGDVGTGWSLAWKINLWARLLDGDHACLLLRKALMPLNATHPAYGGGGVYPNLFDAHPPFQIDGNLGATSGIAEMLLQSHTGELHLLPALPSAWHTGSVTGLRARGGFEVDIAWNDGRLAHAQVIAAKASSCIVRTGKAVATLQFREGQSIQLNGELREVQGEGD